MATDTENTAAVLAAAVVRLDDQSAARDAFTRLIAQRGRSEASCIWVEATRIVEAENPIEPPTHRAPDCAGFCGESYIGEDCEPCQTLEAARRPAGTAKPFECACGAVIAAEETETILDHIDACDQ